MKHAENKQRIAADIVPLLQRYIDKGGITHYVEPFFGGFYTIANIECKNRLGNSNNSQIIARAAPADFAPVWADIGTTAKLFINGGKQWQKYTT